MIAAARPNNAAQQQAIGAMNKPRTTEPSGIRHARGIS